MVDSDMEDHYHFIPELHMTGQPYHGQENSRIERLCIGLAARDTRGVVPTVAPGIARHRPLAEPPGPVVIGAAESHPRPAWVSLQPSV